MRIDFSLTIALPTYNRSHQLERQLEWLCTGAAKVDQPIEILLSDNSSTDATPDIFDCWRGRFSGRSVRLRRHPRNLGAIGNVLSCIQEARGSHVWVVSDDDDIREDAPAFVLSRLSETPDLALLALNFGLQNAQSGEIFYERCFDVAGDAVRPNGQALIEHCLKPLRGSRGWGGLALTSAMIYRTDLARAALTSWPDGSANEMFQLYISAFCARRGPALVTAKPWLKCNSGDHHFLKNRLLFLKLRSADTSEVFERMVRDGYSPLLLLRKLVERPAAFLPMLPACLRLSPAFVLLMQWRYLRTLASVAVTAVKWACDFPSRWQISRRLPHGSSKKTA